MIIGLNRTWLYRASVLAGLLPVLLGSTVIIGWFARLDFLVQVSPVYVPMQFNTALGFLLCGSALLGIIRSKRSLALVLGCSVAAIGFVTIVEYVFLIDLGVDQLFIEHYITVSTLHPGRMAPNTALCFLLSGLAIVAGVRTYPRRISEHILGLSGGIVAALGLVALLGYASGVEAAYGWGRLTQMAVHTSAGFIIFGTGLSLNALHDAIVRQKRTPLWLAFSAGIGVLTLSISMWQALRVESGNADSLLPSFVLIAGFLASILLTLTIWLAQAARFQEIQTTRANEKLRKWEMVFQSAGWGVVIIEKETLRLLAVNPAFAKMHGYTLDEAKSLRVADLHPEERRDVISGRLSTVREEHHLIYEDDHVRKDGSFFPILANITAIYDEHGEILYYAANFQDVTERQLAEKALRESEERYRTVAEDMPVLICLFLPGGEITYVNCAYCRYFEKTLEELVGQTFFSMIPEADRETVMANISALTVEMPTQSHEHHVIAPGGEIRWQRWTNRALFDAKGLAIAYQSTGEDISERKRAEEALRESERNLISAQKITKIGHYVLDIETGYWTSSTGLDDVFGIDENYRRDVAGWLQIVHPESKETMLNYFQDDVLSQHKKFDKEYKIVDIKTGQEKWVHGLGDLTFDENNSPVELFGTIQDITERIQAEAETARLGTVVEQAAVTVFITDTDGNIVYANPHSETSTGYSVAELVGQNPRILKSGRQDDSFYKELWDTITAGRTWNGGIINKRKDGELYHEETTIFPVKNPDGKIINYAAVQRDISKQVRLNEERERLLEKIRKQALQERQTQRRIQQQEQLAAVGQLAAGIAHDFNNFMGVILLYAGMLEKASNITPQDQKRLKVISQQARQATALTQQILDFARRSVLERRPMDLKPFLKEVVKLLEHTVPESIKMELTYGTDEYIVNADPTRMQQVIMNLTVNARDAMLPEGGGICASTWIGYRSGARKGRHCQR